VVQRGCCDRQTDPLDVPLIVNDGFVFIVALGMSFNMFWDANIVILEREAIVHQC